VTLYVRYPLSLRNVEDLLAERGIDISHETVRFWWNRFGGVVRVNSILPACASGRGRAPLFLLMNRRRARPDSAPKIAYTCCLDSAVPPASSIIARSGGLD
jgi:hypothetical protein